MFFLTESTHIGTVERFSANHLPFQAYSISSRWETVVGNIVRIQAADRHDSFLPCFWTRTTGLVQLSTGRFKQGSAYKCSADGRKIVGVVWNDSELWTALWEDRVGPKLIATSKRRSSTTDFTPTISDDGKWIAGTCKDQPFEWTSSSGLRTLVNSRRSSGSATGVSNDGKMVTGYISGRKIPYSLRHGSGLLVQPDRSTRPFVWTQNSKLTLLNGWKEEWVEPVNISSDGVLLIGNAWTSTTSRGFSWTRAKVPNQLSPVNGTSYFRLDGLSADGRFIFGTCTAQNPKRLIPTIWIDGKPLRFDLYLRSLHVSGIPIDEVTGISGISSQGKVIVGSSMGNQGERYFWLLGSK